MSSQAQCGSSQKPAWPLVAQLLFGKQNRRWRWGLHLTNINLAPTDQLANTCMKDFCQVAENGLGKGAVRLFKDLMFSKAELIESTLGSCRQQNVCNVMMLDMLSCSCVDCPFISKRPVLFPQLTSQSFNLHAHCRHHDLPESRARK